MLVRSAQAIRTSLGELWAFSPMSWPSYSTLRKKNLFNLKLHRSCRHLLILSMTREKLWEFLIYKSSACRSDAQTAIKLSSATSASPSSTSSTESSSIQADTTLTARSEDMNPLNKLLESQEAGIISGNRVLASIPPNIKITGRRWSRSVSGRRHSLAALPHLYKDSSAITEEEWDVMLSISEIIKLE